MKTATQRYACPPRLSLATILVTWSLVSTSQLSQLNAQEKPVEQPTVLESLFFGIGEIIAGKPPIVQPAPANIVEAEEQADDDSVEEMDEEDSDGNEFDSEVSMDTDSADSSNASATKALNKLQENFDTAIKLSQLHQRPVLVIFGAQWCSWCRKLEDELKKDEAREIFRKWVVVKVDVDDDPELASELQASALPSLRILGLERSVIASREGFMTVEELQTWLSENLSAADPAIQKVLYDSGQPSDQQIESLIEFLAHPSPKIRMASQQRLVDHRSVAAESVVDTLRAGRLAQQLCVLQILKSWSAPVQEMDPWRPETLQSTQLEPLIQWARELPSSAKSDEAAMQSTPALDDEAVEEWISRYVVASDSDRPALLAQLSHVGPALLPSVRQRLATQSELADAQRIALRELLYHLLAGNQTRLRSAGVLTLLASLDADSHRQASGVILKKASSADQPLVDELSRDSDPLVREATVTALQRLGALRDIDRVNQLLRDRNPSVRTAVLRELSQRPDSRAIEALVAYVEQETDEDLLVYATKALGQMGSRNDADSALGKLAGNASWRVRAAALDAIKELLDNRSPRFNYGMSTPDEPDVAESIATAVLTAASDTDEFVAKRAAELLPKIVTSKTVTAIWDMLEQRPELMDHFAPSEDPRHATEPPVALIAEAKRHLTSTSLSKKRLSAKLLSQLSPEAMSEQLAALLQTDDPEIRLAALQGTVAAIKAWRDGELNSGYLHWRTIEDHPKLTTEPWHALPASLLSTKTPAPKTTTHSQATLPIDDLFSDAIMDDDSQTATESAVTDEPSKVDREQKLAELSTLDDLFETLSTDVATDEASTKAAADDNAPMKLNDLALDIFGLEDSSSDKSEVHAPSATLSEVTTSPSPDEPAAETADPSVMAKKSSKAARKKYVYAASEYLHQWQEPQSTLKRPPWLPATAGELVKLDAVQDTASSTSSFAAWIHLARLASGEGQIAERVMSDLNLQTSRDASNDPVAPPSTADALPWLLPSQRLAVLNELSIPWNELRPKPDGEILRAATSIDDQAIAKWLLEESRQASGDSANLDKVCPLLLRALFGAYADKIDSSFSTNDLTERRSYGAEQIPGQKEAIDWLTAEYKQTDDPWSAALLLAAASHVDYFMACDSAVGLIAESKQSNLAVQVALSLALNTDDHLGVQRAMQWLSHPVLEVQTAAVDRLLYSLDHYARQDTSLGVVIVYDFEHGLPGLWSVQGGWPVESLETLSQIDGPVREKAKLLLLAAGKPISLSDLTEVTQNDDLKFAVVAALAKAERTDEPAIQFYQRASENLDGYREPAKVYNMLRNLKGPEIAAIRKSMRTQYGAEALR